MKSGFYENLDINFEQAYEMSVKEFKHTELIDMLKNGNIPQKQIAAMKILEVNEDEAEILISNLTGCDGKIREAVALKINQLLNSDKKYVKIFAKFYLPLADASIDINGNICRLVIESVGLLKSDKIFADKYLANIFGFIEEAFIGLDNIKFRDKKYTINKQLFKLYWCLESLKHFSADIEPEILLPILERASMEKEYTIREKAAQIIAGLNNPKYAYLKNNLVNDENYYVREVFNKML